MILIFASLRALVNSNAKESPTINSGGNVFCLGLDRCGDNLIQSYFLFTRTGEESVPVRAIKADCPAGSGF